MTYAEARTQLDTGWAVKQGAIGGIIAGIVFAIAEMMGARFIGGNPFLQPLAAIASVPIGQPPPQIMQGYSTITFVLIGLVTHMVFSAIFGIIFALAVAKVPALRSPVALIVAASIWGFILWVVNFYVLGPALGRPWFAQTPALQQFVYHTFFFGTVLGLYLRSVLPAVRTS